jgi:hypothetical protein
MTDEKTGLLEESPGVLSSKRVFGAALIAAGSLLLLAVGVVAVFRTVSDSSTAIECGKSLLIAGAALLGVGVLEGLGSRIGGPRE